MAASSRTGAPAVRWGVLSTARINRKLLPGARAADGAEVVAVGSRDPARGRAFAAEYGIERVHPSYDALLADAEVDAVYIPLPNALHVPWTVRALEAGKHVLCEKPLSRRAGDVEKAFAAADRAGRVLMEGFMWRYHPQTEELSRLARSIAPLRVVRAAFGFPLPVDDAANVRWLADLEGGALMDVGCYCVSALRLLCGGEPERVAGQAVMAPSGVDVRFTGLLQFPDGVLGTFDCGFDVPPRGAIELVGEGGTVVARDPWHGVTPGITFADPDGETREIPVEAANPYQREIEDLSRAIRDGGDPRLGRDDALGQARVIEALYASAGV